MSTLSGEPSLEVIIVGPQGEPCIIRHPVEHVRVVPIASCGGFALVLDIQRCDERRPAYLLLPRHVP